MNPEAYESNRVLIVDDQPEIHEDFEEMLKPGPSAVSTAELMTAFVKERRKSFSLPEFELLHANGGEEACDTVRAARAENRPIAVVYVDVRMPPGSMGLTPPAAYGRSTRTSRSSS